MGKRSVQPKNRQVFPGTQEYLFFGLKHLIRRIRFRNSGGHKIILQSPETTEYTVKRSEMHPFTF
ncbi:MAG: hypothetical protein KA281_05945, partial [Bacteroidia bacterium]|nr:hypothetical protein [Bacteroidia bacterium]